MVRLLCSKQGSLAFCPSLLFLLFSWSVHATPPGCGPITTLARNATHLSTDSFSSSAAHAGLFAVQVGNLIALYELSDTGVPTLRGEIPLPSNAKAHIAFDSGLLIVSLYEHRRVGSGSHSSPANLRTVKKYSLSTLAEVDQFTDSRVNNVPFTNQCVSNGNIFNPQQICGDVFQEPTYVWDNWRQRYQCSSLGGCSWNNGMLGLFHASSGGRALVFRGIEYTSNFFRRNFPDCVTENAQCFFTQGAMTPGFLRINDGTVTEEHSLPDITPLVTDLELPPQFTPQQVVFHTWNDVAVDAVRGRVLAGMDVSLNPIGPINPDLPRLGAGGLVDMNSGEMLVDGTVTIPFKNAYLGSSVAVVGRDELQYEDEETNQVIVEPVDIYAWGAPGQADISNNFLGSALAFPTSLRGGSVVLSYHRQEDGEILALRIFASPNNGNQFGTDISALGDIDGDTHPELLSGAPSGRFVHIFSSHEEDLTKAVTLFAPSGINNFGKQVGAVQTPGGRRYLLVAADNQVTVHDADTCYVPSNFGNGSNVTTQPPPTSGPSQKANQALQFAYQLLELIQESGVVPEPLEYLLNAMEQLVNFMDNQQNRALLRSGSDSTSRALNDEELVDYLLANRSIVEGIQLKLEKAQKNYERAETLAANVKSLRRNPEKRIKTKRRLKILRKRAKKLTKKASEDLINLLEPVASAPE